MESLPLCLVTGYQFRKQIVFVRSSFPLWYILYWGDLLCSTELFNLILPSFISLQPSEKIRPDCMCPTGAHWEKLSHCWVRHHLFISAFTYLHLYITAILKLETIKFIIKNWHHLCDQVIWIKLNSILFPCLTKMLVNNSARYLHYLTPHWPHVTISSLSKESVHFVSRAGTWPWQHKGNVSEHSVKGLRTNTPCLQNTLKHQNQG